MKPNDLDRFFKAHPQFDRDDWRALVRPCIDIALIDGNVAPDDSYFGGKPFLPKDFELPQAPKGNRYLFIGQINLAQIGHAPHAMPKTGLLSLFYLEYGEDWEDGDDEPFWGDDGFVKAFYFADTTEFVVHDDKDAGTPSQKLAFIDGVSPPDHSDFDVNYPSDMDEFHDKLYETFGGVGDHLFGYPTNDSLGYDPTPKGDWLPFLNLQSHKTLNWCWHDGDRLMVFIEKSALVQGDFSNIKTDAG